MNLSDFRIPDEHELVEFFGREAVDRSVEDGYWCYEVTKRDGTVLRFSLNLYERSVQTEIRAAAGSSIATISHEMATRLAIDGRRLRCEFACAGCCGALTVDAERDYIVAWSVLRTE